MFRREDKPPKLIVNRRAVSLAFASIVAMPVFGKGNELQQMTDGIGLTLAPQDFADMTRDGLFLPDYRFPMCRMVCEKIPTGWIRYNPDHLMRTRGKAVAIEICAPDSNGAPRFAQIKIG